MRASRIWLSAIAFLSVAGAALVVVGLFSYFHQGGSQPQTASTTFGDPSFVGPGPTDATDHPGGTGYSRYSSRTILASRPDVPLRLSIDRTGVDAPVGIFGLDEDNLPEVPLDGDTVAWYDFSAIPGTGGNAVFSGHVSWGGDFAVFGDLAELEIGDAIRSVSADGTQLTYTVSAKFEVDPEDPRSLEVMESNGTDMITLITCGGSWIPNAEQRFGGDYENRVIVQAIRTRLPSYSGF